MQEIATEGTSQPRCAAHPSSEANAVCARCGAFLCGACTAPETSPPRCRRCELFLVARPPSTRAVVSLWLCTFGFLLGFPGLAGLVMAHAELKQIRAGHAPPAGEPYARVARTSGLIILALLAVVAMWALDFSD